MANKKITAALAAATLARTAAAWHFELPSCLDPFKPFVEVGCFADSGDTQALVMRSTDSTDNMTVESCVSFCKGNGYRYAGLEYYGVCFCGQTINSAQLADDQCNFPCNGNKSEICGGNQKLSVWVDPTFGNFSDVTEADYKASGCWTDNSTEGRALSWRQDNLSTANMTTETCLDACKDGGFPYAGLEYGGECYCGVALGNFSTQVDDSQCNMACGGSQDEICGGPSLLSLYVADELMSLEPCSDDDETTTTSSAVVTSTSSSVAVSSSTSSSVAVSSSTSSSVAVSSSTSSSVAVSSSTSSSVAVSSSTSSSVVVSSSTSSSVAVSSSTSSSVAVSSSTVVSSTSTSASSVPVTTPPTTTKPPVTSTTTSTAMCTTTVSVPSTCEYGCGSWCANPLPDFSDKTSCQASYSSCKLQAASCFKETSFPTSVQCFIFSQWCESISSFCWRSCPGNSCSKSSCYNKNPPSNHKPDTTTTSVYPCAPTSTKPVASSTTTSSTTTVVPSATSICKQPSSSKWGYSPGNPCGGIELPIVTCNDDKSSKSSRPWKLYNNKNWWQCPSYGGSSGAKNACSDACATQRDSCLKVYAEGCKQKSAGANPSTWWKRDGETEERDVSYFDFQSESLMKRTLSFSDSYQTATQKCYAQYYDCMSINSKVQSTSCN
ncbi:hypothetical protein TD95_000965 [Thielaviopsis punctulata]|uniref:WSC domain-containing protein n=1 Tax=Thielaviopsis punctulata TaxID=72032 RepID=A0A0F4ZE28_9PEZI|nr:hypothetical protein TD95_000965 [Thielaviopsis punctulata]